jgi:hypothetical protein
LWYIDLFLGNDSVNILLRQRIRRPQSDGFRCCAKALLMQQWNQCRKRRFLCGSHISSAGQRICFLCCGSTRDYIRRSQQQRQTHPLVREGAPPKTKQKLSNSNKYLVMSPRWGSAPRLTDWLTVSRNVTLTLTLVVSQRLKLGGGQAYDRSSD